MSFSDLERPRGGYPTIAFLNAVLGSASLTAVGVTALALASAGIGDWGAFLFVLLLTFALASIVIALAGIFIGLPLTVILGRSGLERSWTYPLAGFLAGALIMILLPPFGEVEDRTIVQMMLGTLSGALPGCICGAIWWVGYRRHRQGSDAGSGVFD